jgi:hypothetical protein
MIKDEIGSEIITDVIKSRYTGIEKMNLINEDVVDCSNDRKNKFAIVSMQLTSPTSTKDWRFDIIKEYVLDLDVNKEAIIFGQWSDYFKNGYPQFKGYIATKDLDDLFKNTRYTLVLPTQAKWVTSKYAEMLQQETGIKSYDYKEAKQKLLKRIDEEEAADKPDTFSVVVAKSGNDVIWKKMVPTGTTVTISTIASNLTYDNAQAKMKSIQMATVKADV